MMKTRNRNLQRVIDCYAAQLPVIGRDGQARLHQARVHISGLGRIGSTVALNLAAAGVGYESANDPQTAEMDNLGPLVFARLSDLGKHKAFLLEEFFHGRPDFVFQPLPLPAESGEIDSHIQQCDLVISCANTVAGRLAAERKAIRFGKPAMQVAALDGQERLGGMITLKLPENDWSACFGCLLGERTEIPRGEGLLSSVTSTLAALASNMAVAILTGVRSDFLRRQNVFFVDLENYAIDALAVERGKECRTCGAGPVAACPAADKEFCLVEA
jgi:molybdopterin/thiamine biosynthesis adenylyltransferase